MKKSLILLSTVILLPSVAYGQDNAYRKTDKPESIVETEEFDAESANDAYDQYPNFTGQIIPKYKADSIISHKRSGVKASEGIFSVDSNYSLNFSKNWSVKSTITAWNLMKQDSPENEAIFRPSRGFQLHNTALAVEELQAYFEAKNFKLFAGKFDPKFGPSYDESTITGVFSDEFRTDRDLVEQNGFGGALLYNGNELTASTFFADTSILRNSMLAKRSKLDANDGSAANTSGFDSYSITLEGKDLFEISNLSYHIGYRHLGVEKTATSAPETGYTTSLAYTFELENNISLTPYVEYVKLNNYTGDKNRNNSYSFAAVTAKYDKWSASVLGGLRSIEKSSSNVDYNDYQLQFSVGYSFTDRLSLDVSTMKVREADASGLVVGAKVKYAYKF